MKIRSYLMTVAVLTVLFVGTLTVASSNIAAIADPPVAAKTCRVTKSNGTRATIVATGKSVFLAHGASLTVVSFDQHQGYMAVRGRVGGKLQRLAVYAEDTNCER